MLILLVVGVVGYKIIAGYSWINAIYMTVITITTVGFKEVQPLDYNAKVFTIFLILTSVVILVYAIKVITEYILSRNNYEEIKRKKMQKRIDAMSKKDLQAEIDKGRKSIFQGKKFKYAEERLEKLNKRKSRAKAKPKAKTKAKTKATAKQK